MTFTDAGSSHTNWALIGEARGEGAKASQALEQLVKRYWPAVFAYVRQSGCNVEETSDLTQGFVCEIMLGRNMFDRADPSRGRFRSFLLTSLHNYLVDKLRSSQRTIRTRSDTFFRIDRAELTPAAAASNLTPEQAFSIQWHATLVRRVLERMRNMCQASGMEAHWRVFDGRVVKPMLFGDPVIPYAKLVELLDLDDAGQAANMMVTMKRRFVRTLIEEVGCTVNDPIQIEEELRALLNALDSRS